MFKGNLLCLIEKITSQFFPGMVPGIKLQMHLLLWMSGELTNGWTWSPSPDILLTLLGYCGTESFMARSRAHQSCCHLSSLFQFVTEFYCPISWLNDRGNNKRLWNFQNRKKPDTHTVKESGGAETLLRSADCTLWIL